MWEPDPGWQPLPRGMGTSSGGVWIDGDRVVKRVSAPTPGEPAELDDPRHFSWWRRPVEVALSDVVTATAGLRAPAATRVEDDDEGATIWIPLVRAEPLTGPFVARALGRFAGEPLPAVPWLARHQLADRISRVEVRGGWGTLARTSVAEVVARVWQRRGRLLADVESLPQVLQHGDPVPGNMVARDGDHVLAVDWATLGSGPAGADLGYWALSAREELEPLVEAYCSGLPDGVATRDEVLLGARLTAVFTALTRADWALSRVADAPGALSGKYRHPSVAPHLRALQRQLPQLEALL